MSLVRRIYSYVPRYHIRRRPENRWKRWGQRLLVSIGVLATAYLVFISYPQRSYSAVAWVAWIPFIIGLFQIRRPWVAFSYGWLTGFLFHLGLFYWIYYTCLHGGDLSVGLSVAAWMGLSALLSLQTACWAAGSFYLTKTGWLFPLCCACGFVTLEWVHQTIAYYGLGFPWLMWGYSQWNAPEFLQIASFTGVYGVSFLLVFISACLGWALVSGRLKNIVMSVLFCAIIWGGIYQWGKNRLAAIKPISSRAAVLQVAVVQPNIDQYKKWDPAFEQEIADTISYFGQEIQTAPTDVVIWPESVTPGELTEEPYQQQMQTIAEKTQAFQVIGSSVTQENKQYVGAYLLAPNQIYFQMYRKQKLVPFGEYIPLENLVRRLFPQVTILGQLGMFSSGPSVQPLLSLNDVLLGSTICYEAIFPQVWRRQAKQGAQLFANLTNDAWFFDTDAPYQHLAANVLRAVETGRPVLRAANTGISAIIDEKGNIEQKSGLFESELLRAAVTAEVSAPTFYATYGDWLAWLCAVLFITVVIFSMVFMYE